MDHCVLEPNEAWRTPSRPSTPCLLSCCSGNPVISEKGSDFPQAFNSEPDFVANVQWLSSSVCALGPKHSWAGFAAKKGISWLQLAKPGVWELHTNSPVVCRRQITYHKIPRHHELGVWGYVRSWLVRGEIRVINHFFRSWEQLQGQLSLPEQISRSSKGSSHLKA